MENRLMLKPEMIEKNKLLAFTKKKKKKKEKNELKDIAASCGI